MKLKTVFCYKIIDYKFSREHSTTGYLCGYVLLLTPVGGTRPLGGGVVPCGGGLDYVPSFRMCRQKCAAF